MDWLEEKAEQLRLWVCNLSFCKAMFAYIVTAALLTVVLSKVTMTVCYRYEVVIWNQYADELKQYEGEVIYRPDWSVTASFSDWAETFDGLEERDRQVMRVLDTIRIWCPFFYSFITMAAAIFLFYKNRMKRPLLILKSGVRSIKDNDLDVDMQYDSKDEMGQLCRSFDEMRMELVHDKEELWQMLENQKRLNAAFAHDLRTPLTVLKGYSDFLARYIPEGKVSEQKTLDTLALMSSHLDRLEQFSRTMKGIRSMEELPLHKEETSIKNMKKEMEEIIFALNQIGDIEILLEQMKQGVIFVDKNIIIEVLENLLSNAIRYAVRKILVSVDYQRSEGIFFLTVSDDGPGFTEEELKKAVLPYYREHADRKEHFGIGLHICALLCEKHGGTLSIANSIAGGAVVTASFKCLSDMYKES